MEQKNLRLPVTTKWFEMTKSGEKTEDYREITPYWIEPISLQKRAKLGNNRFC